MSEQIRYSTQYKKLSDLHLKKFEAEIYYVSPLITCHEFAFRTGGGKKV